MTDLKQLQTSALRGLVDKQTWKCLEQAEKKGDDKLLQEMKYIVKCETCKKIFLETSLLGAKQMYLTAQLNPELKNQLIPFAWYIQAARHFIPNTFHSIRCLVVNGSDRTVVKDLSSEWKRQFPLRRLRFKTTKEFNASLNKELDWLESLSIKAYGVT